MTKWTNLLLAAVVLFVGLIFFRPQLSKPTFGLVLKQGDLINDALEQYRVDHHTYPQTLKVLVPEYIGSIEKPKLYGRQLRLQLLSSVKWKYSLAEDRESYYLRITDSSRFGYDSSDEEWTFHPRSQTVESGI